MAAYQRQRVAERWLRFSIPRAGAYRHRLIPHEPIGDQRHQGKQSQEYRRRPGDGPLRPLPLRFHTEVRPRWFEGNLERPAADKPQYDVYCRRFEIRAQ